MTFDYRASQLRTSKIIASGSTGTGAKLLLYPIASQGSPLNQGNINPALFGTGSIGSDVFLYVSGVVGGTNGTDNGITLFGGDVVSSGTIKSEIGLRSQGDISFQAGTAFSGTLSSSLTADRLWQIPDASGDIALTNHFLAGPDITITTMPNGYIAISSSAVSASRTINTSSPIGGGGNLGSDLTLSLDQTLLSISSSQIADATIYGRYLLTASNTTDQRDALGLGSLALQSSVSSSQINDSSAIGRAVLTGSSTSSIRTTLEIQDGPRLIFLAPSAQSTTSTVDTVIGGGRFDPSDYSINNRTTVLTFESIGQVVSGVTGTLTLYNVTDSTTAATLTWTETTGSRKTSLIAFPASASIYEVRLKKSGGAAADYVLVYGTNITITWS